jgi:hypothetical protein
MSDREEVLPQSSRKSKMDKTYMSMSNENENESKQPLPPPLKHKSKLFKDLKHWKGKKITLDEEICLTESYKIAIDLKVKGDIEQSCKYLEAIAAKLEKYN